MTNVTKTCARCTQSKRIDLFSVDRQRIDGRNVYCLDCSRARNREAYQRNKAAESERKRLAYITNRVQFQTRNRKWRESNREKYRARNRAYYYENPDVFIRRGSNRKAAFAAVPKFEVTTRDLDSSLRRNRNSCVYCGASFSNMTVSWDHVIPIARGGSHCIGNLVPSCKPCNSSKRQRTVTEWRMGRGAVVMTTADGEFADYRIV